MKNKTIVALKGVLLYGGKILIVKRADNDQIGAGTWECPGGKLEFGETLEDALRREVAEETGLRVRVGRLLYASSFFTSSVRQVILLNYLCAPQPGAIRLSAEHSDYLWAGRQDLRRHLNPDILRDFENNGVLELENLI